MLPLIDLEGIWTAIGFRPPDSAERVVITIEHGMVMIEFAGKMFGPSKIFVG